MEKKNLKVGQTVWIYVPAMSHGKDGTISESAITKLGNKYFYAKRNDFGQERKFEYVTGKEITQYNYRAVVYLSKEEYECEQKTSRQLTEIKRIFSSYGKTDLSPEQIEAIYNIITPTS